MPYCPECGIEVDPNDFHCINCGEELPKNNPARQRRQQRQHQEYSKEAESEASPLAQGLGALSALVAVVGVFMPWLEVSAFGATASATGLDFRVGTLALLAAGVALLLFIPKETAAHAIAGVAGMIVLLLVLFFLNDPLGMEGNFSQFERELTNAITDVGGGAYVTLAGGIGMTVGALGSILSK